MSDLDFPHKIPNSWAWTRLEDIVEDIKKINPKSTAEKEFQYIDIASIDNNSKKIVSPKLILGKNAPSRARQSVRGGDIVFS